MDPTRWDTGQVIDNGVLNRQVPEYGLPTDREVTGWDVYDGTEAHVREALEAGKIVDCSEYYGIPRIWKTNDGYRAILLQYRNVTEDHTFKTADETVEWFIETARAVAG